MSERCGMCGVSSAETKIYPSGLCRACEPKATYEHFLAPKKEKYEEIKQIALNVFVHNNCCIDSVGAWKEAERFYEYAKQKQEGAENA